MDALWIALGVVILVVTFLDTFLAVLNYDESGILVNRVVRWEWLAIRAFTRRVSRRWRPLVLRQVTGVLLLTTILGWITGLVLGFAFIYLGLIGLGAFQIDRGVVPDFVGALYLSVGQFATVGADNISPAGGWVNLVPVAEALMSVVLLSFTITFLGNIYGVIQFLRSLCADFFQTGPGVGSPPASLRPYLPGGEPRDLDRHLNELVDDFNLYCDSLRQDHGAYYFQSGQDQFSLPFALYMTSGVVSALSWGLPAGHPATTSPSLVRLREVFDGFRDRRYRVMRWRPAPTPDPVAVETFRAAHAAYGAHTSRERIDPWVLRFLALDAEMADIVGAVRSADADEAYARYAAWLAFSFPAQQFVTRVSRDLDYQPVYEGDPPVADPDAPAPAPVARRRRGLVPWLRRRLLFLDPGGMRLGGAARALIAVAAAVVIVVGAGAALGVDAASAGVFAALLASAAMPLTTGGGGVRTRLAGLLALLPVAGGITAGALVPRDPPITVIGLAVVAAIAIWIGRFGRRWALCGRIGFLAFFFALLLTIGPADLALALVSAAIGVLCGWGIGLLPARRDEHVVRAAVDGVAQRVVVLLDAVVDELSDPGDRRLARTLQAESTALRNSVSALAGLIEQRSLRTGQVDRVHSLQLRAFDVQLAAGDLVRTLPAATDEAATVDVRSRLAGRLVDLQRQVQRARRALHAGSSVDPEDPAPTEPEGASPTAAVIRELAGTLDALFAMSRPVDRRPAAGPEILPPVVADSGVQRAATRATDRRAVQGALATGLGLYLGGLVSPTHQLWAALPAYHALTDSDGERIGRTVQRLLATVAGAAAGFGLALWSGHEPIVAFAVVGLGVFFVAALRAVAPAWTAFWQTVLLATLYDQLARLDAEAIQLRVLETVIGAAVALLVAAVILPTRTRARVLADMSALVSTAGRAAHGALQRLADPCLAGDADAQRRLADDEATLQRELDDVLSRAGWLRGTPGALQHSGIEPQLTSLTVLALSVRHLCAAVGGTGSTVSSAQWQELDAWTGDNVAAALAVLSGRLPASIRTVRITAAAAGADDPAVEAVLRINETLVTLMGAVRPGATDPSTWVGRP